MPRRKDWIPKNAPRYVTAKELAGYLGVSVWCVRDMPGDGRLPPPISTGRRAWQWDTDQVRAWIAARPWLFPRRRAGMNVLRRRASPACAPRQAGGPDPSPEETPGACQCPEVARDGHV